MSNGYVLDFTDRTFTAFFAEHGVQIDGQQHFAEGGSKAKRLRYFLKNASPLLAGQVLAALLQHRLAWKPAIDDADLKAYRSIVNRLGGQLSPDAEAKAANASPISEAALLILAFQPGVFTRLPLDAALSRALVDRMQEAQRCIQATAYLSAVILCGSVLEGLSLGFGSRHAERVNRGFAARYGKSPGRFHEWRLKEWIEVLGELGDLSPNVEKFGSALREFRNYVHPAEQLAHRFSPDKHTARIAFQVVVAAADDLLRAEAGIARDSDA
ncbi:hypothetical protein [Metallibacterium scheffleri]